MKAPPYFVRYSTLSIPLVDGSDGDEPVAMINLSASISLLLPASPLCILKILDDIKDTLASIRSTLSSPDSTSWYFCLRRPFIRCSFSSIFLEKSKSD